MTPNHSRVGELLMEALEAIERTRQAGQESAYPGLDAVARELARIRASSGHCDSLLVGRIVTDGWPFDSPLSAVVLAATRAYEA